MKNKLLTLALTPLLTSVSCSSTTTREVNIICASGAPAVAFYNHALDDHFITSQADAIKSQFTKNSEYTIIVVDLLSGINAIKNGAPYKLAANLTFGNFYLAATGNDDNTTLDATDEIVIFGQGTIPDKLFHYVYGDTYNEAINYVPTVQEAKAVLETGKNGNEPMDYVLIAQPALFASIASQNNPNITVYANMQELYATKSNGKRPIQASVFIKNTLDIDASENFLTTLESDIENALNNPTLIKEGMDQAGDATAVAKKFGTGSGPAFQVTKNGNGMGLGFERSKDIKEEIDAFLSLLGAEATSEKIYY